MRQEHTPYLDRVAFNQLKDADTSVLAHQNSRSLSELFFLELKFTVNTLNKWFKHKMNSNFLELNDIQIFRAGQNKRYFRLL